VLALCKIVIGYRLTPRQKANLVNIVRKRLFKRTLAIGDGANDSLMLQEAHIGVGIYG
jgi:P-type E1-E2 ATPase